jgi:hypothetical protein
MAFISAKKCPSRVFPSRLPSHNRVAVGVQLNLVWAATIVGEAKSGIKQGLVAGNPAQADITVT